MLKTTWLSSVSFFENIAGAKTRQKITPPINTKQTKQRQNKHGPGIRLHNKNDSREQQVHGQVAPSRLDTWARDVQNTQWIETVQMGEGMQADSSPRECHHCVSTPCNCKFLSVKFANAWPEKWSTARSLADGYRRCCRKNYKCGLAATEKLFVRVPVPTAFPAKPPSQPCAHSPTRYGRTGHLGRRPG